MIPRKNHTTQSENKSPASPEGVVLFHHTNYLVPDFRPREEGRPAFFWFSDRFHSHYGLESPPTTYVYMFVVKPSEHVKLFTRHGNSDFTSMWNDFQHYSEKVEEFQARGEYIEPGIVLSFDTLEPTIIFETKPDFTFERWDTPYPDPPSFKAVVDGIARPFKDIPELVEMCPDILSSVPVIKPTPQELYDTSKFWVQDVAHLGKQWL